MVDDEGGIKKVRRVMLEAILGYLRLLASALGNRNRLV